MVSNRLTKLNWSFCFVFSTKEAFLPASCITFFSFHRFVYFYCIFNATVVVFVKVSLHLVLFAMNSTKIRTFKQSLQFLCTFFDLAFLPKNKRSCMYSRVQRICGENYVYWRQLKAAWQHAVQILTQFLLRNFLEDHLQVPVFCDKSFLL